ncbi:M23 family metallopeptidase [Paenibacillus sp. FSL H8-0537]|uniref:M23 family metallopeptidase n=1 Tax=Paenibacillus sp. FSL H8-0537 TaxID=2921399 RepID=UPI003101977C
MNNENKPKQGSEETPKNGLGASSAAGSGNGFKRLLARKWVSPAIFMAAAAIIVTLMWVYQGADDSKQTTATEHPGQTEATVGEGTAAQPESVVDEVIREGEQLQWPVVNKDSLQIETPFYDASASSDERQAAMVQTGNTFSPHMGIDLVDPNDQPFDVVAAMSGKVSLVLNHPTNGSIIEINHGEGLVTTYQSLSDVNVAVGDEVKQGTIIAKAARNELEKDLGVHLHFEVRENGKAVNPSTVVGEQ